MWAAHLIDLRSGRLGAQLDLSTGGGTWREVINGIPEWTLTVGKESLDHVPDAALLPWACGTVVTFDGEPLLAGPIIEPYSEGLETITLECQGIEATVAGWKVLPRDYDKGGDLREDAPLAFTGLSLGEIQWRIVQTQMARTGLMPIVHGVPASTGNHQRTYETWNLANNNAFDRIVEVAEVINGPDFAFWPRWRTRDVDVEWAMVHGIGQTTLPQEHSPVIDLTAQAGPTADFTPMTEWDPATCVYGIGAGEGAGTLVSVQRPQFPVHLRIPVREDVLPDTGTDDWALVQAHARAEGVARVWPTYQLSAGLDVSHPSAGLRLWRCGHAAEVTIGPRWRVSRVLPETGRWRAIARSGSIGASTFTVELQPDGEEVVPWLAMET